MAKRKSLKSKLGRNMNMVIDKVVSMDLSAHNNCTPFSS